MARLNEQNLRTYLEQHFRAPVRSIRVTPIGKGAGATDVKGYGYGVPLRVDYELADRRGSLVLETVTPGPFGHEHMADRARILLWSHAAFNRLPRHVQSPDVGAVLANGTLQSLGEAEEFFIVTDFVPGVGYNTDLEALRDGRALDERDIARVDALCDYLVAIHQTRGPDPELYERRLRELVGDHECIMGIVDSYPATKEAPPPETLKAIEHACLDWRWRLKPYGQQRLRQIHGDFHPWNILFEEGPRFVVLDRSRGEWGDPADDVAALTINYLFFSLQRSGCLEGAFDTLFRRFWDRYVALTGDEDLAVVVAPFFAFRGLVVANPLWYPTLPHHTRTALLHFVQAVLNTSRFDPRQVNAYCRADATARA